MVVLKKKSWYMWILKIMWGLDYTHYKSLCPLFWSVILSVILFIPWLIIWKPLAFIGSGISSVKRTTTKKISVKKEKAQNLYRVSKFILEPLEGFIESYFITLSTLAVIMMFSLMIMIVPLCTILLTLGLIFLIICTIFLVCNYIAPVIFKHVIMKVYNMFYTIFMVIKEKYCPLIKWC